MTGVRARESSCMPTTDATAQPPPAERADRVYRVLQSLRTSFIRIGVVALIFSIGGYYLAESILRLLQRLTGVRLAAYGIPETFFSFLNLGLAFGVFASMPYILYAILDEFHQSFVPGRNAWWVDVAIDSVAAALALWAASRWSGKK